MVVERRRSVGVDSAGRDEEGGEAAVTNIKVAVRCRPMSTSEKAKGENSCFRIEKGSACLENPVNPSELHRFGFDLIYGGDSEQAAVWRDVGVPALGKAFAGFNTTIFAYGQTGSGKTFSMQGVGSGEGAGIIPRLNEELFARVTREREADANKMFLVTCSYFEIYNEVVYDLLDPNNRKKKGASLEIREHTVLGIYVKGLQEMVVTSPDNMQRLIDQGMLSRTVGSTAMNDTSSRSHSVFTVKVHQKDATDDSKNTFAKINLVDLAGSERAKSTGATGARLKEGANINKSLSSLGNVINALVEVANGKKGVFVPYRNSKLTRVLQESLGGNSLTAMLAALSPAACNFEETLSTLKYASRAKSIKVNAVKNEEASQVSRLEEEIRALKKKLAGQQQEQQQQQAFLRDGDRGRISGDGSSSRNADSGDNARSGIDSVGVEGDAHEDRYKQQIAEIEAAMKSTWEEKAKQSQTIERERQRLQQQLEEEGCREERERKKRWRALEDKGDLELSIREAKEVALPTLPAKDWLRRMRALVGAENRAREEATVCGVYREALARELEGVFAGDQNGVGDEDDRASVASTVGTVDDGDSRDRSAHYHGTAEYRRGTLVLTARGTDACGEHQQRRISYDSALLRQLQARLTSLRDARERLNGPLTRAVEENSRNLLQSVEAFSEAFAASPHEHLEREGDQQRPGRFEEGRGGGGVREGGQDQYGAGAAGQRRWEARKSEGTRALVMIRRQILARNPTRNPARKSSSSPDINGVSVVNAANVDALCTAAEFLARALEAVLSRDGVPDNGMIENGMIAGGTKGSTLGVGGGRRKSSELDVEDSGLKNNRGMGGKILAVDVKGTAESVNGIAGEEGGERLRALLEALQGARVSLLDALAKARDSQRENAVSLREESVGGDISAEKDTSAEREISAEKEISASKEISAGETLTVASAIPDVTEWGFRVPSATTGCARPEHEGESVSSPDFLLAPEVVSGEDVAALDQTRNKRKRNTSEDKREAGDGVRLSPGWFRWDTGNGCEDEGGGEGMAGRRSARVVVDFGRPGVPVASVVLQQAVAPAKDIRNAGSPPAPAIELAGLSVADSDGSVEKTEAMVGLVFGGWGAILKNTSPTKLLERPPVRFLYDLFVAVGEATGFGAEITRASPWENLSGKKEKTRFMDSMATLVGDALQLETPPAKGCDIVVGQECTATNRFLQLLALAAEGHRRRNCDVAAHKRSLEGEGDRHGRCEGLAVGFDFAGWARNVEISTSDDALTWQDIDTTDPGGTGEIETSPAREVFRRTLSSGVQCRFLRLKAPDTAGESRSEQEGSSRNLVRGDRYPASLLVRVKVEGPEVTTTSEAILNEGAATAVAEGGGSVAIETGASSETVMAVDDAEVGSLLEAIDCALDCLLQQSLELARIEAANQERKMAMRTNQMESLEKRLKAALEAKTRLAKERKTLMDKALGTEEENLRLQENVLRLTADAGRERVENATIAERLAHAESTIDEEKARSRELESLKRALEDESEDLQNQVEVLTEERDVARSHEENLFALLTDKTEDLEALQESYVSLTDRWNDFQDEHDELQEQIERLRATLKLNIGDGNPGGVSIPSSPGENARGQPKNAGGGSGTGYATVKGKENSGRSLANAEAGEDDTLGENRGAGCVGRGGGSVGDKHRLSPPSERREQTVHSRTEMALSVVNGNVSNSNAVENHQERTYAETYESAGGGGRTKKSGNLTVKGQRETSPVAFGTRPVLSGGGQGSQREDDEATAGAGGYDDGYFDEFCDESSEEDRERKAQERKASVSSATEAEVYRPPSGNTRGKTERPKSAARRGRSASFNGGGI